jgi:hypothetical protein
MSPNRSLAGKLFAALMLSLLYFCLSVNGVYAESENIHGSGLKFSQTNNIIITDDPPLPGTEDSPLPVPADTDFDTDVDSDGLDFFNFLREYLRGDCSEGPPCWFDFNYDELVDGIDLTVFTQDFGRMGIDVYESDDTSEQAGVVVLNSEKSQHHNFHQTADEDWMSFIALENETYRIETNLSDNCVNVLGDDCDVVLELYEPDATTLIVKKDTPLDPNWNESIEWTCPENKSDIYYVRVYLYNPSVFGTAANYFFRIYQPTAPFPGTIIGTVKNSVTKAPIPYARIFTNAGGSAISFPNGVFIIAQHPAGNWLLTATAGGYKPYSAPILVPELKIVRRNIEMAPN